jgi:L-asparagine transporter-like permease
LRSTYSITLILTLFVLINCFNALHAFDFVIKLAGLVFPLIYLILAISLCLYN